MTGQAAHPSLVAVYTNGWCPMFACALRSLRPGLVLVETGEDRWHVAAHDPVDDVVWDVEGPHSPAEFTARWGDYWPLIHDRDMRRMDRAGDWEGLARWMTAGGEYGEPSPAAWAITVALAAEVLAAGTVDA